MGSDKLSTGFRESDFKTYESLQRAMVREDRKWEEFVIGFKKETKA